MELVDFKRRLQEYMAGPPSARQRSAPHTGLIACIDEIGDVRPEDRIGRVIRRQGVNSPEDFEASQIYVLDVELWDLGRRDQNNAALGELQAYVSQRGGHVTDTYIGESLVLCRVHCSGTLVQDLLAMDAVARVDVPPRPSLATRQMLDIGLGDLDPISPPPEGAPAIGVLDSGITAGHPLLRKAVGEATAVPQSVGDGADEHGHGTMVAGLALYGDVARCISARRFVPELRVYSARVLNGQCAFDNEKLITSQMRDAIEYFAREYGCRVFNISLGDPRQPYRGGKVSPWASILDILARELDVVLVVSVGNCAPNLEPGTSSDAILQDYPRYLLGDEARVIEPGTGAIVLTVGSLAEAANIPGGSEAGDVGVQSIAQPMEPSPFTRSGPGLGKSIKPELCDCGGNLTYDGRLQTARALGECSVVSLNMAYLQRLFATDSGTSYAAPRVAHLAARLVKLFPGASANLIRALLVASASIPEAAQNVLSSIGRDAALRVCGYGMCDYDRARVSDDNRVVLYSDTSIGHDQFHVYEVPVPEVFTSTRGRRSIAVTLAFDPPVRHSRFDYLGVKMSFRLVRGQSLNQVVDFFESRDRDDGKPEPLGSSNCRMTPGPQTREGSTLQKATFTMHRNTDRYGDTYYLVVRCERNWARDEHAPQRYAVVLSLEHQEQVDLYNIVRERVLVRARARS